MGGRAPPSRREKDRGLRDRLLPSAAALLPREALRFEGTARVTMRIMEQPIEEKESAAPPAEGKAPDDAESLLGDFPEPSILEKDDAVWDLVFHLVHPSFIYVILQLVTFSHFQGSPELRGMPPLSLPAVLLYGGQFLGAWAILYTVLLRDMGLKSPEGTWLLLLALAGAILAYLLIPDPSQAAPETILVFLGIQSGCGAILFLTIWTRWRRYKARVRIGGKTPP